MKILRILPRRVSGLATLCVLVLALAPAMGSRAEPTSGSLATEMPSAPPETNADATTSPNEEASEQAPEATSSDVSETNAEAADSVLAGDEVPKPPHPAADAATKAFDIVVTRPLGLCSLILGFTFFSISAPIVAVTPAVNIPTSWDLFVLSRWDYTFVRPLGEL